MKEWVKMCEILDLIDVEYDYGQAPDMKPLMDKIGYNNSCKHLVIARNMNRYFNYYAKDRGETYYSNVIRTKTSDKSSKDPLYSLKDIYDVIRDPDIQKRIEKQKQKKTRDYNSIHVPICIYDDYIRQLIASGVDEDTILYNSGMSEHQLNLVLLPDEDLFRDKKNIEKQMSELTKDIESKNKMLNKLQSEYDDIIGEINCRRFHFDED